eukprot:7653337-Alexandrium_andersonii.AAC.1
MRLPRRKAAPARGRQLGGPTVPPKRGPGLAAGRIRQSGAARAATCSEEIFEQHSLYRACAQWQFRLLGAIWGNLRTVSCHPKPPGTG